MPLIAVLLVTRGFAAAGLAISTQGFMLPDRKSQSKIENAGACRAM
jgi:hypothetical protein